jgi:hypothetical protein
LATLNLSTTYEDFGNNYRDGSGEGKGKILDQEIDDMQRAPGGTTSNEEDELDKTGIIFKLIDKETKVCLPSLGSYVKFDSLWFSKGFKDGEVKTNLSAQLLSSPKGNRRVVQGGQFETGLVDGVQFKTGLVKGGQMSNLKSFSKAINENWQLTYMHKNYDPPTKWQLRPVNREKTQKIKQDYFSKLDDIMKLTAIFQEIHKGIQVRKVWFLMKKNKEDGFEKWHTDYHYIKGGSTDVSSTIVVTLGMLPNASEEEEEE